MIKKLPHAVLALFLSVLIAPSSPAQVLDKSEQLTAQDFWVNRDFDWYKANIPFFECPDDEIVTTYYYRWELVTRHICYGSPNSGYSFTEFANRPFWSGRYGAIACPSGHQFYDIRWLRDPIYARDYLRYWFHTPGAQPRKYSSWMADSAWATHRVHPNKEFIVDLLPDLTKNYQEWQRRQWVPGMGLYWQLGHDDGMEFDINARQTRDILRGGQSLRPSFNAYMWADARALARITRLAGDDRTASEYSERAALIKKHVQERLWDPKRQFFFPMSNQRHEKDGHVIEKHTLTYASGKHAGSPHGRELHGYVPWAFGMPDAGYEEAWKFLMDPDYFYADFGPTTVERNDPMFLLKDGCCWWSGQSWPFATTQTLKAMARVLQDYEQDHISRRDYVKQLNIFSVSHRKDGRPYIAEALSPFTGSWRGHDMHNRSEHYFHSGFVDLVITGLCGLRPRDDDKIVLQPLIPDSWSWFALDDVPYKGHRLTIVWDKVGSRYGHGPGLHLFVDGKKHKTSADAKLLEATLPSVKEVPLQRVRPINYAVNNDGDYYPRYTASFVGARSSLSMLSDGQFRYDIRPSNRWTSDGSPDGSDWVEVDLGTPRPIHTVRLYLLDDGEKVVPPKSYELEHLVGETWKPVPGQKRSPARPAGRRPNMVTFETVKIRKLRVRFVHSDGGKTGLTEIETWGPGKLPYVAPPPPAGNIAFNRGPDGFPKATASHSDRYGGTPEKAIDGRINYQPNPVNRWTSYGSPNKTDWLQVDFGEPKAFARVELLIYDDRGGVQPPESYRIQFWDGDKWRNVNQPTYQPKQPRGSMANSVRFDRVTAPKMRVEFTHKGRARSGLTEIEIWRE